MCTAVFLQSIVCLFTDLLLQTASSQQKDAVECLPVVQLVLRDRLHVGSGLVHDDLPAADKRGNAVELLRPCTETYNSSRFIAQVPYPENM